MSLSGFAGGAADALHEVLRQKFLEMEARRRLAQGDRSLDLQEGRDAVSAELGRGRLDIDRQSVGLRDKEHTQKVREYDEGAPMRAANLRLNTAQAGNLESLPQREATIRAHDVSMANLRNTHEMGQIGARGAQDRQTLAARPQGGGGEHTTVQQVIDKDGKPALVVVDRAGATARPIAMPDGFTPSSPRRPVTGQERRELGFFIRMLEAEKQAREVEGKIGNYESNVQAAAPEWLANWLQTPEGQRYVQAQRAFTEGRMRADSGAAVPASEYEMDRQKSFRVSGDQPESLGQKRGTRLTEMRAQAIRAGRALEEHFGEGATIDSLLQQFAEQQESDPVQALINKYGKK